MEKLRRGRRARGTGPFQARLDGMGWPAMRTPLGGRREFRVAAFYAPARKLLVTFGRGAAPPRPREGWDGGRAAGALAASVAWLPPPGPPPRAGEGGKGVAGRVPHPTPPARAGGGHHDPQAPAPPPAGGGGWGGGPRRRRACCFRRLAAPHPGPPP